MKGKHNRWTTPLPPPGLRRQLAGLCFALTTPWILLVYTVPYEVITPGYRGHSMPYELLLLFIFALAMVVLAVGCATRLFLIYQPPETTWRPRSGDRRKNPSGRKEYGLGRRAPVSPYRRLRGTAAGRPTRWDD